MSSSNKSSKSKTSNAATKTAAGREATKKTAGAAAGVEKASASGKAASGASKTATVKAATKNATATSARKSGVSAKEAGTKQAAASTKPATSKSPVTAQTSKGQAAAKAASSVTTSKSKGTTATTSARPKPAAAPAREAAPAQTAAKSATNAKTETTKKLAPKIVAPVGKATVAPVPAVTVMADAIAQPASAAEKPVAAVSVSKAPAQAAPLKEPEKAPAQAVAKPKAAPPKNGFKLSEFIVYPAHGVGQIIGVEVQEVAGFSLELYVVSFIKDKMILKVPTSKVTAVGMRKLAETNIVEKALSTLSGRARVKRTMWSRRAQEYEAKINSGDLVTIAEVVRDLYRSDSQPEQSYSERQLYEAALDRMAREISAVRRLIDAEALKLIESFLQKGPRRGAKSEADVDGDIDGDDADVERAA